MGTSEAPWPQWCHGLKSPEVLECGEGSLLCQTEAHGHSHQDRPVPLRKNDNDTNKEQLTWEDGFSLRSICLQTHCFLVILWILRNFSIWERDLVRVSQINHPLYKESFLRYHWQWLSSFLWSATCRGWSTASRPAISLRWKYQLVGICF